MGGGGGGGGGEREGGGERGGGKEGEIERGEREREGGKYCADIDYTCVAHVDLSLGISLPQVVQESSLIEVHQSTYRHTHTLTTSPSPHTHTHTHTLPTHTHTLTTSPSPHTHTHTHAHTKCTMRCEIWAQLAELPCMCAFVSDIKEQE